METTSRNSYAADNDRYLDAIATADNACGVHINYDLTKKRLVFNVEIGKWLIYSLIIERRDAMQSR